MCQTVTQSIVRTTCYNCSCLLLQDRACIAVTVKPAIIKSQNQSWADSEKLASFAAYRATHEPQAATAVAAPESYKMKNESLWMWNITSLSPKTAILLRPFPQVNRFSRVMSGSTKTCVACHKEGFHHTSQTPRASFNRRDMLGHKRPQSRFKVLLLQGTCREEVGG